MVELVKRRGVVTVRLAIINVQSRCRCRIGAAVVV